MRFKFNIRRNEFIAIYYTYSRVTVNEIVQYKITETVDKRMFWYRKHRNFSFFSGKQFLFFAMSIHFSYLVFRVH